MSKMVSARIPDALFDRGCAQLEELGASQTQLIRAAFDYLLEERSLPRSPHKEKKAARRKLSDAQRRALGQKLASCRLDVRIPSDVAYDKETAHRAREAKYEAVS